MGKGSSLGVGVKAGREAAAAWQKRKKRRRTRAETWPPGRTWTGPWAGRAGGVGAEPAGPLSACWARAAGSDA